MGLKVQKPMDESVIVTESVAETLQFGERLASSLSAGEVIAIDGPLGSGKTVLVRGVVKGLGGDPSLVGSPTFGIAHEYPIDGVLRLVHVDCYRLSGPEDLESIGWEAFAGVDDAITIIEWADRIRDVIPSGSMHIAAGHRGDCCREYEITRPTD